MTKKKKRWIVLGALAVVVAGGAVLARCALRCAGRWARLRTK